MKKTLAIVLAMLMAASLFSLASAASPSISAGNITTPDVELDVTVEPELDDLPISLGDIRDAIENADSAPVEVEAAEGEADDLSIRLKRMLVDSEQVAMLREIALFIEQLPVAICAGEEAEQRVFLMDEIYNLKVEGYDASQGDVDMKFEFVTEYEDDAILMVMVGAVPAADETEDPDTAWFCLDARAEDGRVCTTMPAGVLQAAADDENAMFALLRVDIPVEEE